VSRIEWLLGLDCLERLLGLAIGWGIRKNVRRLYQELSELYKGPDDTIYLFGFSRGAFTVRALAGLIYRCGGLPGQDVTNFNRFFRRAYRLYKRRGKKPEQIKRNEEEIAEFRKTFRMRDCAIHFLGIWDTVKSYGGIWPIMLPALRHNPIVRTVRHALALNE